MNAIALVKNKMKSAIVAFLYFPPVHVFIRLLAKNAGRVIGVMIAMFFVTAIVSGKSTELESMLAGLPWLLVATPFIALVFASDEYKVKVLRETAEERHIEA